MTNEEFQKILRSEVKNIKRGFLNIADCPKVFRQWNKYKIELRALKNMLNTYRDVKTEEWEYFIKLNPTTLSFVNNCLTVVPNMLEKLRDGYYEDIITEFYQIKRDQKSQIKTNRGKRKFTPQYDSDKVEEEDGFIK